MKKPPILCVYSIHSKAVFIMEKTLRRWEAAALIAVSIVLCTASWAQARQNSVSSKLVRLHVVAVSDDGLEQAIKLRVRDVVLGAGEGHNWWCVVFPPLCLSAAEGERLQSVMGQEDFSLVTEAEGYVLRFRTVELWGEIVNMIESLRK